MKLKELFEDVITFKSKEEIEREKRKKKAHEVLKHSKEQGKRISVLARRSEIKPFKSKEEIKKEKWRKFAAERAKEMFRRSDERERARKQAEVLKRRSEIKPVK